MPESDGWWWWFWWSISGWTCPLSLKLLLKLTMMGWWTGSTRASSLSMSWRTSRVTPSLSPITSFSGSTWRSVVVAATTRTLPVGGAAARAEEWRSTNGGIEDLFVFVDFLFFFDPSRDEVGDGEVHFWTQQSLVKRRVRLGPTILRKEKGRGSRILFGRLCFKALVGKLFRRFVPWQN